MTGRKGSSTTPRMLLLALAAGLLAGCSTAPTLRAFNGSFTSGLDGWEVHPEDRISVVGDDRILNVRMFPAGRASLRKTAPLDPRTDGVRISFRVRYEAGAAPWTRRQPPSYQLILQEPGMSGDAGYTSGTYLVNPHGRWETHEIVQLYGRPDPGPRVSRLRPLPAALIIKINVDEGDGSLQFDEFRVQEFVTRATIEHR